MIVHGSNNEDGIAIGSGTGKYLGLENLAMSVNGISTGGFVRYRLVDCKPRLGDYFIEFLLLVF